MSSSVGIRVLLNISQLTLIYLVNSGFDVIEYVLDGTYALDSMIEAFLLVELLQW